MTDIATGGNAPAAAPMRKSAGRNREIIGICAALAILVFIVYGQTLYFDFVNYDDNGYVYENPEVTAPLTLGAVARAFTHKEIGLWTPLVTISHMLDWQLYGSNAGGHHLTNVLLHLGSAILLFLILRQMTGALWRSAFVAAVFAIHPLRVESVAWIAERKDVLSGLFFMLTLGAYLRYVQRPDSGARYLVVIFLFALGLMCKPMLVTLPFVLLLLDYWPLKRLFRPSPIDGESSKEFSVNWRAVLEKIPLLALSLGLCVATMLGGSETGVRVIEIDQIPFWTRMREAPVWLVTYLLQMVWPAGLAVVYTHFEESLWWWPVALAFCGLLSLGIFLLRRKYPWLWMGWLWNLGMLLPVIGFFQISRHARADHYNYLPQIGLYIGLTWVAADWAGRRWDRRMILGGAALVILCTLPVAAWDQTTYWRDSESLWTHALECTQDNSTARNNLGLVSLDQGRTAEAIAQFHEALEINPADEEAHYDLGIALCRQGHMEQGLAQYREALRINPADGEVYSNIGLALLQEGRIQDAIAEFHEALRINPALAKTYYNLGNALFQQGHTEEAIAQYRAALKIDPALAQAHANLGVALFQQRRTQEAIAQYREALKIDPSYADAHSNLGNALSQQGRTQEAIAEYREAVRINPGLAEARYNLGNALLQEGQFGEAIAQTEKVLELQPADPSINNTLAWMLAAAPQTSLRDGHRAVQLATQASQSTGANNPDILRTLAAAYAQAGQFSSAVQTAQKALQLAQSQSNTALSNTLPREIKLYEAGRPFEDIH
jgi:tetratricopeptide (TPR) repeat protein